jgi:ATP-dependent RNA helicase DHX37/DHR1
MHQPRVGYNDRARGSTAGGKKKGKRRSQPSEQTDPNVTIHVPKTTEERQMEKKERMKQDVCLFLVSLFRTINCFT